jgi:hypothetical protein
MCKSGYMLSDQTWKNLDRYRPTNYNPFLVPGDIPYGNLSPGMKCHMGSCPPLPSYLLSPNGPIKENFYASSSSSWTPCGNVTPANSPGYGTYLSNNLGGDCASMGLRQCPHACSGCCVKKGSGSHLCKACAKKTCHHGKTKLDGRCVENTDCVSDSCVDSKCAKHVRH